MLHDVVYKYTFLPRHMATGQECARSLLPILLHLQLNPDQRPHLQHIRPLHLDNREPRRLGHRLVHQRLNVAVPPAPVLFKVFARILIQQPVDEPVEALAVLQQHDAARPRLHRRREVAQHRHGIRDAAQAKRLDDAVVLC